MLRNVLIVFGWAIPLISVFLVGAAIYLAIQRQSFGLENQPQLWIEIARAVAHGVQNLVLSPLCFFGAYMLEKQGSLSE